MRKETAFSRDALRVLVRDGKSPEELVAEALRLGELCLDVFLASLPEGTSREEARRKARQATPRGRRRGGGELR